MKYPLLIFAILILGGNVLRAQNEDEEYQRKLEAWKKQKEEIERQNKEKLNSLGSQKAAKAHFKNGGDYYRQETMPRPFANFRKPSRQIPRTPRRLLIWALRIAGLVIFKAP